MTGDKLGGVHPYLVAVITRTLTAMGALGFRMIVTNGVRTAAEQQALYAQGRTLAGPIVTNADGVTHRSNHQVHPDGLGHAVDCCFLDLHGQPTWERSYPWRLYGEMGKALGLSWGGDWATITDLPHLELPDPVPGPIPGPIPGPTVNTLDPVSPVSHATP